MVEAAHHMEASPGVARKVQKHVWGEDLDARMYPIVMDILRSYPWSCRGIKHDTVEKIAAVGR